MDFIMENPVLWGIVLVVLLVAIIVVISIIVSKRRRKEVEEIEKMFPAGNMDSEDIKISVERVRRATKERESRKHKKKRIHRERPREAHPDEDKEIVWRDKDTVAKQNRDTGPVRESETDKKTAAEKTRTQATDKTTGQADMETVLQKEPEQPAKEKGFSRKTGKVFNKSDLLGTTINRHKIEKGDYNSSRGRSLLQQAMDLEKEEKGESLAAKQKTHQDVKTQTKQADNRKQAREDQGAVDKATSRRMFKRSLLKPDKESKTDSGKLSKASLIDTQMFSGKEEKDQAKNESDIPPRNKQVHKKSLFSKRKQQE